MFLIVTEVEILNGIIKAENVEKNVLVFFREIENIENILIDNKNKSLLSRFIDIKEEQIDQEAKELRENMRKKIYESLPQSNIFELKPVKWNENDGITNKTHEDHVLQFGELFLNSVINLIDQNVKNQQLNEHFSNSELLTEILTHAHFTLQLAERFHGREDITEKV